MDDQTKRIIGWALLIGGILAFTGVAWILNSLSWVLPVVAIVLGSVFLNQTKKSDKKKGDK